MESTSSAWVCHEWHIVVARRYVKRSFSSNAFAKDVIWISSFDVMTPEESGVVNDI